MAYGTVNADVIQTSTSGGILGAGNASILKNRIINGAMVIDQRNNGASITPTTDGTYSVDRWCIRLTQASKISMQQNAGSLTPVATTGFVNYLGLTSTSAYSATSTDIFTLEQIIEGYNMADLAWGTANAKPVTLSFWAYSSKTGTFGGSLFGNPANYSYPFTYSIPVANTWTQISISIAGPTGGTGWTQTNGAGIYLNFDLGSGSTRLGTSGSWASAQYWGATGDTSIVATSGATFYITGVQLEVGSSATGYEYRQYTTELQLCQRYLPAFTPNGSTGIVGQGQMWNNSTTFYTYFTFQTTTRVPPTGITVSSLSHFKGNGVSTDVTSLSAITVDATTVNGSTIRGVGTGGTANQQTSLIAINASAQLLLTGCEL
jgi:hypothetical protein